MRGNELGGGYARQLPGSTTGNEIAAASTLHVVVLFGFRFRIGRHVLPLLVLPVLVVTAPATSGRLTSALIAAAFALSALVGLGLFALASPKTATRAGGLGDRVLGRWLRPEACRNALVALQADNATPSDGMLPTDIELDPRFKLDYNPYVVNELWPRWRVESVADDIETGRHCGDPKYRLRPVDVKVRDNRVYVSVPPAA